MGKTVQHGKGWHEQHERQTVESVDQWWFLRIVIRCFSLTQSFSFRRIPAEVTLKARLGIRLAVEPLILFFNSGPWIDAFFLA